MSAMRGSFDQDLYTSLGFVQALAYSGSSLLF